ncbi:uncharacterized protein LOC113514126 isoform X1 [Galleria mellonella]|uniref:Uncharacterized protein LOC113514126 isoform X1 n=1 Tax=Galleria mellonella TaxID=7137 RepID=A0ABM3MUW4_GALME|nr:uncharacterized protein LOC113514126 isoform X1 [Galleria mellonella]
MCESSGALLFNWPRDTSRRVISLRLDIVASARCSASAAARRTPHAAHSTSRPAPPPPAAVTPSDMRTKDRLAALKKASAAHGVQPDGDSALQLEPSQHQRDINDILEEVGRVRDWIRELTANTLVLRHLHADPTFHTNKLLQDRLDSVITSSNAIGLKICGALVQLEGRTREPSTATSNHVRARILRLQYAVTRRLYADALADHQRFLEVMHDHQLHLLQEQIKLTNLSISDDECQALLDTKNLSLFVDNCAWCGAGAGGHAGGAARAARGGGAPRAAGAHRGLRAGRARPVPQAVAPRRRPARADRQRATLRAAGDRLRGERRAEPHAGRSEAEAGPREKDATNNILSSWIFTYINNINPDVIIKFPRDRCL